MLILTNWHAKAICLLLSCLLMACSATPVLEDEAVDPKVQLPNNSQELGLMSAYSDPWEGFNRRMYYFNAKADEYVLLPIVAGYKKITPDFIEKAISNFFSNLDEISTFFNSILQLKFSIAGETLERFALNSTIGLAGLFDVATVVGLNEQNEDFGQTLGYWGVGAGPFLVLPLMGPSSLRDATALVFDALVYQQALDEFDINIGGNKYLSIIEGIDTRAVVPFRYYASGSAFEYESIKLLYMKYREIQVAR